MVLFCGYGGYAEGYGDEACLTSSLCGGLGYGSGILQVMTFGGLALCPGDVGGEETVNPIHSNVRNLCIVRCN